MEAFWDDLRFALRLVRKSPGFALVAILTLALGIGANTAIFTLFNAVLLESLPVREPSQLVLFSESTDEGTMTNNMIPSGQWGRFSWPSYQNLTKQSLPFKALCAYRSGESAATVRMAAQDDGGKIRRAAVHLVSGNYFTTMGVDAGLGRLLTEDDDRLNAQPVAVVSNGYWRQRLNADSAAVGKTAILNGYPFTIVGVTPPEFFGERVGRSPDFWVPLVFQPQIELRESYLDRTDTYWLRLTGRLQPGATREQAQVATTIALQRYLTSQAGSELTPERRSAIEKTYVSAYEGGRGISGLRLLYSQPLRILLAVVAMVLLIACANVGNLLLARAVARRGEIAVRLALGGSRGRLIRQLLTESLVLAFLGAGGGLLLAHWGVQVLIAVVGIGGSTLHPHIDVLVLSFTLGVTILAGVLFGMAPALQAGRTDLIAVLKAGGGRGATGHRRFGATQSFVIGQITISLVLVVGANLFARSLLNLERQPLGFNPDNVLIARINPRLAGYKPAELATLYRKLYDRMNALPGVRVATIARFSPLGGYSSINKVSVQGYKESAHEQASAETVLVGPSYSETLGMPLLLGRAIGLKDTPGSPKVAMVNEAFVNHYFRNQNPIGRRFGIHDPEHADDYEIAGVLKDAHFEDAKTKVRDTIFLSIFQAQTQYAMDAELELRTAGDPGGLASSVRSLVAQEDSNVPVTSVQSLRNQVEGNFDRERLAARLISFFGALALLLACIGLYGVMAQGVARRTNEIGIRMALGAQRSAILRIVLRDAVILLCAGLALGIPAAYAASRVIANQLFGLGATDILSYSLAIAILASVTVFASFFPARRATKVDPMVALRYE